MNQPAYRILPAGLARDLTVPTENAARNREIDGLRAFAVSAVIFYHWTPFAQGGFIGVDLFFVISGFVITRGLLNAPDLKAFYRRRFFRIVPPLAAMLAVFAGVLGYDRVPAFAAMFSFMNWYRAFGPPGGLFNHAWSLSIEEQFYLLWPLCCGLLLTRGALRRTIVLALIVIAVWRVIALELLGMDHVYNGLDTHCDGLLLGCLLVTLKPVELGRWWLAPAVLFVAVILLGDLSPITMMALPLVNLCAAALVTAALQPTCLLSRLLTNTPVQWLGTRSYGVYLWHYPVGALHTRVGVVGFISCLVLTFVIAELSWRLVEQPFVKFGRTRRELAAA